MIILGVASLGGLLLKGSNRDEARYNAFATGRFEVAKNRELRGEERAMVVPEGKSNGSENHHSRDGVGQEQWRRRDGKNFGRGGSTVRTKTNPRTHHTDSAA
jgi:hypothetical protein